MSSLLLISMTTTSIGLTELRRAADTYPVAAEVAEFA